MFSKGIWISFALGTLDAQKYPKQRSIGFGIKDAPSSKFVHSTGFNLCFISYAQKSQLFRQPLHVCPSQGLPSVLPVLRFKKNGTGPKQMAQRNFGTKQRSSITMMWVQSAIHLLSSFGPMTITCIPSSGQD
jgi:hypothetical protein